MPKEDSRSIDGENDPQITQMGTDRSNDWFGGWLRRSQNQSLRV